MPTRITVYQQDIPEELYKRLQYEGQLAWDIETSGLDWAKDRIATCQIATRDGAWLVRIVPEQPPRFLMRLLATPAVRKVFHYAMFDLRFMLAAWGGAVRNVVCTKIASKLLRPQEREHSLKYLVHYYLGVEMDKGARLTDWFADTLSEEQLAYAAADVAHLLPLFRRLEDELVQQTKYSLARTCFEYISTRLILETGGYPDVFAY